MTTLRSGTVLPSNNPQPAGQHAARAPTHPDTAINIRYLRNARRYQRITGDSAATLRQKRRWLHNEHQAGRISGKAYRELMQFYSKRNISKPKHQLPKARGLSDTAQSIKQQLDALFHSGPDANSPAGAMDESHGGTSGNAGEGSSGAANHLEDPQHNGHQVFEESTNGRVLDEPPNEAAADTLPDAYIKPEHSTGTEDDMETEDESSTEEDDLVNHADQTTHLPANTAEANDAAARQRILELGLQLTDHSGGGLDTDMRVDYIEEVKIKREEEGNE